MQMQRLFEIVYMLLAKRRITAKELAEHFEVSTRTIYRDLDTLSMAGIPLYTNKGSGGGIFLMEDYVLQKSLFTEDEQQKLMNALQSYQVVDKKETSLLLTKLSSTFQKQHTNWIEVEFGGWGDSTNDKKTFLLVKDAILSKHIISFTYHNTQGETTQRTVEPFKLLFRSLTWYLIAYCEEKQGQRIFKLSRMNDVLLTTKEIIHEINEDELQVAQKQFLNTHVHLTLEFDPRMAFRIYDEFKFDQIKKQDDGSYIVTIDFQPGEWLYGYLLSFGDLLKVLEPPEVKEELKVRIKRILHHYENKT